MLPLRTGATTTGSARLGSNPFAPAPGPGPPDGACAPGPGVAAVRFDHQYQPPAATAMSTRIATIQRHAERLRWRFVRGRVVAFDRRSGGRARGRRADRGHGFLVKCSNPRILRAREGSVATELLRSVTAYAGWWTARRCPPASVEYRRNDRPHDPPRSALRRVQDERVVDARPRRRPACEDG